MFSFKGLKVKSFIILVISLVINLVLILGPASAQSTPQMYQITSGSNSDIDPAWSSDGKKILFKRDQAIWLADTDGKSAGINLKQVSPLYAHSWSPAWRKNTNEFYYIYGPGYWYVMRQPIGGAPSNVFWVPAMTGAMMGHQASSPDGSKVTFVWMSSNWNSPYWTFRLYTTNADGSNIKQLHSVTNTKPYVRDTFIEHPSWSPDGKKIAFTLGQTGSTDIWVINDDGTGLTKITDLPGGEVDPAWSPDGKKLVFAYNANLWTINADGTEPKQVTSDGGINGISYGGPDWSPDGKSLVFYSNRAGTTWDIWTLELLDDTVPPTTTVSVYGDFAENNWYTSDVQISLTATDNEGGSGVAKTEYSFDLTNWVVYTAPFTISNEETTKVYYRSVDQTNNVETAKLQIINIDKTPPTIAGVTTTNPNVSGWYNNDVVVQFTASDAISGVNTVTPDIIISTDGASQSVTGIATDKAGNSASFTVTGINIDKTSPQVIVTIPTSQGEYLINQNVAADWSVLDELSGIASATGTVSSGQAIDTSTVGTKTFNVVVTDNAGNQVIKTVTYRVGYKFGGVLPPIQEDGSKLFKYGSTVPVKFRLNDANGYYVSDAIGKLYVSKIENGTAGEEIEAVSTSSATTGNMFRYDNTDNLYIFNLATKNLSVGTWQLRILLDDGTSKSVVISLK